MSGFVNGSVVHNVNQRLSSAPLCLDDTRKGCEDSLEKGIVVTTSETSVCCCYRMGRVIQEVLRTLARKIASWWKFFSGWFLKIFCCCCLYKQPAVWYIPDKSRTVRSEISSKELSIAYFGKDNITEKEVSGKEYLEKFEEASDRTSVHSTRSVKEAEDIESQQDEDEWTTDGKSDTEGDYLPFQASLPHYKLLSMMPGKRSFMKKKKKEKSPRVTLDQYLQELCQETTLSGIPVSRGKKKGNKGTFEKRSVRSQLMTEMAKKEAKPSSIKKLFIPDQDFPVPPSPPSLPSLPPLPFPILVQLKETPESKAQIKKGSFFSLEPKSDLVREILARKNQIEVIPPGTVQRLTLQDLDKMKGSKAVPSTKDKIKKDGEKSPLPWEKVKLHTPSERSAKVNPQTVLTPEWVVSSIKGLKKIPVSLQWRTDEMQQSQAKKRESVRSDKNRFSTLPLPPSPFDDQGMVHAEYIVIDDEDDFPPPPPELLLGLKEVIENGEEELSTVVSPPSLAPVPISSASISISKKASVPAVRSLTIKCLRSFTEEGGQDLFFPVKEKGKGSSASLLRKRTSFKGPISSKVAPFDRGSSVRRSMRSSAKQPGTQKETLFQRVFVDRQSSRSSGRDFFPKPPLGEGSLKRSFNLQQALLEAKREEEIAAMVSSTSSSSVSSFLGRTVLSQKGLQDFFLEESSESSRTTSTGIQAAEMEEAEFLSDVEEETVSEGDGSGTEQDALQALEAKLKSLKKAKGPSQRRSSKWVSRGSKKS